MFTISNYLPLPDIVHYYFRLPKKRHSWSLPANKSCRFSSRLNYVLLCINICFKYFYNVNKGQWKWSNEIQWRITSFATSSLSHFFLLSLSCPYLFICFLPCSFTTPFIFPCYLLRHKRTTVRNFSPATLFLFSEVCVHLNAVAASKNQTVFIQLLLIYISVKLFNWAILHIKRTTIRNL
jgi:hypothetical protein